MFRVSDLRACTQNPGQPDRPRRVAALHPRRGGRCTCAHRRQDVAEDSSALDLLLTPWTGTSAGYIAGQLRKGLGKDHRKARIAQSTSRVVASVDFPTLVRVVVPLTGWWQRLDPKLRDPQTVSSWIRDSIKNSRTLTAAMSNAGSDVEFYRYAALVGFIDRLMNANSAEEIEKLASLARRLGARTSGADVERQQTRSRPSSVGVNLKCTKSKFSPKATKTRCAPRAAVGAPGVGQIR